MLYIIERPVLIIEEVKGDRIIYQSLVEQGQEFAIKYTHSVENTPVWDYFKVAGTEIILTGTKYMSYGAGLPFLKKDDYSLEDDKFIIEEINKRLNEIPLRVSDYAKHKLLINGENYRLYSLTTAQNLVMIKVEIKKLYEFLAWRVKDGRAG